MGHVAISFATGGWYESAILKLESAGIKISNIPIASANDHHSRIEIMKIAEKTTKKSRKCIEIWKMHENRQTSIKVQTCQSILGGFATGFPDFQLANVCNKH